uniref:Putative transcription activator BRLF1 homolog n=1 Tax=Saimiriine herpesvirus 2 (strain 11) TaxID=10383 RepID=BRLF1_SHV21|nr:RecName: Full=Putative transcription activator BRLF1 homolog; AltName: Full=Transcription activator EDRF1 [Herpesvirus saimiri (strain 11)]pir/C36811/ hypothetical protein ORF50 - saimiriine herpesvirus 1 (strain 11) [Saimiriine alphaherpesvirus 1]
MQRIPLWLVRSTHCLILLFQDDVQVRKSCLEPFLFLSPERKREIHQLLVAFNQSLVTPTQDEEKILSDIQRACLQIAEDLKHLNPFTGLLLDLNLYTLWTLLRNYKTKQRSQPVNSTVVSRYAHHVVKYIMQRLVYTTDRLFLTAPTSGIVLPVPLANAIFNLLSHCRKKCTGLWRNYGTEKSVLMGLGKEITLCYQALNESGIVSTTLAAFIKLSFPTISIPNLFKPMFQSCKGNQDNFPDICTQGSVIRRPHQGVFGDTFPIPDPLMREISENSFKKFSTANISTLLQNPKEILEMDPFDPRIGGFPLNKEETATPLKDSSFSNPTFINTGAANTLLPAASVTPALESLFSPTHFPCMSDESIASTSHVPLDNNISLPTLVKTNFPLKRKRQSRNIDPNTPRRPRGRPKGSKTKKRPTCSPALFQSSDIPTDSLHVKCPEMLPTVPQNEFCDSSNIQPCTSSSVLENDNLVPINEAETDDNILATILQDLYDLPAPPVLCSHENQTLEIDNNVDIEDLGLSFPMSLQDFLNDE